MGKNKGSKKKGSNQQKLINEAEAKALRKLEKSERRQKALKDQDKQRSGDLLKQTKDKELKREKEREDLLAEEILQRRNDLNSINEANKAKAQNNPVAYREAREMKGNRGSAYDRNTEDIIRQMNEKNKKEKDEEDAENLASGGFLDALKSLDLRKPPQSSSSSSMFQQGNKIEPSSYQSSTTADNNTRTGHLDSYDDDQVYESNKTTIAESNERREEPTTTQLQLERDRIRDAIQKFNEEEDIAEQGNLLGDFPYILEYDDDDAKTKDGNPLASVEHREEKDEQKVEQQFEVDASNFQLDSNPVRRAFTTQVDQAIDPDQTIDNQITGALALNTDSGFYNNTEKLSKFRSMEDRFGKINKSKFNKELDLSRFRSSFGSTPPPGRSLESLRQTSVFWKHPTRKFSNNFVGLIQQGVATQNKLSQEFMP